MVAIVTAIGVVHECQRIQMSTQKLLSSLGDDAVSKMDKGVSRVCMDSDVMNNVRGGWV